ncbi:MAG: hypothetical protein JO266_11170 [Acidobacteria bacterium]|nr:hypothetical protein [Acidobacteriota bacterium]
MIPASAALDLSFNFVTPSRQVCEVPRQLYWVDPCREFRLLTSQPLSRQLPVLFLCLLRRSQFILLLPFRFLEQLVVAPPTSEAVALPAVPGVLCAVAAILIAAAVTARIGAPARGPRQRA